MLVDATVIIQICLPLEGIKLVGGNDKHRRRLQLAEAR